MILFSQKKVTANTVCRQVYICSSRHGFSIFFKTDCANEFHLTRRLIWYSLEVTAAKMAIIAVHHTHTRHGPLHRIPEGKFDKSTKFCVQSLSAESHFRSQSLFFPRNLALGPRMTLSMMHRAAHTHSIFLKAPPSMFLGKSKRTHPSIFLNAPLTKVS